MYYYNNILVFEAEWLIDNGIMSDDQYRNMAKRHQINVVRRGCRNTPALVAYDSIPERFKDAIKNLMKCDPYEAARVNEIEIRIKDNAEASKFFEDYLLADGRNLPKETRIEYYTNAIVLDAISTLLADRKSFRAARGTRLPRKWDDIAVGVQNLDRTKYPHTLPANARRLEDRYKRYKKEGLVSLIHKNFMNINAASVDDEVKESYLAELLAAPNNLDNSQVARLYNMIAGQMGWKQITRAAVGVWRKKLETTIYARRRGSVAFSNTKAMQVKRSAPNDPMIYWTLDGWDVELLYQKVTISKYKDKATGETKERQTITYHHRPTVVVVLDACCKYPIGYAVGTHETPELTKAALRNAAQHTAQLFGKMYRANQLQSDRYSIKTLTPIYEVMAKKVTPARAKNAKAKIIEPYFNSINKKWCQMLPNWSGFGITSDRDKQPNTEYLNKYKSSFPDFEGVCTQVEMIIQRERDEKIEKYMELWNSMDESKKIELSQESYLLNFGETTGRTILLRGSGLHPTILGQRRDYDCFDVRFRDFASEKWKVMYDPDDLSHVLAVNDDETRRFVLEEKYVQPMALTDQKEGDSEQLKRVRDFNKGLTDTMIERGTKSINIVRQHIQETRSIDDETLKRILITDSAGQHKNVKSQARRLKESAIDAVEIDDIHTENVSDRY
ncbi:MAG TPA: hypothetical protein DEG28_00950 [Porphyromonadaceae bacterium]|nr:hypothetical protein [Porphyromonadaceae bacterium]